MVRRFALLLLMVVAGSFAAAHAADPLTNVPRDALGFVIIHQVSATDAKVSQVFEQLGISFPGPIAFFQAVTGVNEGIDFEGPFVLFALPGREVHQTQYAVWLAVEDYDRLVSSLGAVPDEAISAITVAGEDLLVTRRGEGILVMDPSERQRMEKLPDESIAELEEWRSWLQRQDAAAVILPAGVRRLVKQLHERPEDDDPANSIDFGASAPAENSLVVDKLPVTHQGLLQGILPAWLTASPAFRQELVKAKAVGIGLRIDEATNAIGSVRLERSDISVPAQRPLPPSLYTGGSFVLYGAGRLPSELRSLMGDAYVGYLIDQLRSEERMVLPTEAVERFRQAIADATAHVESALVLSQPGSDENAGIYTNDYLVVHSASADRLVSSAQEVMRLWNSINREAEASTQLVFDVAEVTIENRVATNYALDVAGADGAPALPEIRQAMEKFFGPGGKLQFWIVPIDKNTVLFARGTRNQLERAIDTAERKLSDHWQHEELAATGALLPAEASWRCFFSPSDFNAWHRRQVEAMTGPVIGGPLVAEMPEAEPIGAAGGDGNGAIWMEVAIPADTLQAIGTFYQNQK